MVHETVEASKKFGEHGESNLSTVKKAAALRDVQNLNRAHSNLAGGLAKNSGLNMDTVRVSGLKRSSPEQSPNSQLVYVRRKPDAEPTGETNQQVKEAKVSGFSPSLPVPQSTPRFIPGQTGYYPFAKRMHWEERYRHLQAMLKKLDGSDHEDYVHRLRSISSVELSRHAVELEKRSIQLSLEEAKEIQKVLFLNVLGKNLKPPLSVQQRLHPRK